MKAFENAQYNASELFVDYERELHRLEMRWYEIQAWYDKFAQEYERRRNEWKDAECQYLESRAKWRDIWARREVAKEFNSYKKWWQEAREVPDLPPEPEKPKMPSEFGFYRVPDETLLFDLFLALKNELQAGYQAAKIGGTLSATADQMTEIFNIVKGVRLDNLFGSFDKLNPPRSDAGNN